MIKSITIRDVACYDQEGVTFEDLAKVNFIYGGNGTGKTTLGRVLERAGDFIPGSPRSRNEGEGKYKNCRVEWEDKPVDVLAYNTDFRERNLQEDIPGVFTIGEEYIKTERDPDQWRERRSEFLNLDAIGHEQTNRVKRELLNLKNSLAEELWVQRYLPYRDMEECMKGYTTKVSFAEHMIYCVRHLHLTVSLLQLDTGEAFRKRYKELFVDENDGPDNPQAATLRREREQLTNEFWRYMAQKAEPMVKEHDHSVREANAVLEQRRENHNDAMHSLSQVDTSIRASESIMSSLKPSIERINTALRSMGFTNFSIQPSPLVHHHYQIQRDDGSFVENSLSEGEQTFITFLYYMQLAKGMNTDVNIDLRRVLVIDDPISSLDKEVMYVVVQKLRRLMDEVLAGEGQVQQMFIMTHNSEFHRLLSQRKRNPDVHYWKLVKSGGTTRALACGEVNPERSDYEMQWEVLRELQAGHSVSNAATAMRKIYEAYFVRLGGYNKDRLIRDHFAHDPEELDLMISLRKWMDEGSHGVADELYVGNRDEMNARYLEVFHRLFVRLGHEGHYDMMMNQ